MHNEVLRTELEYYSDEQKRRVVEFEDALNRVGSRVERESEGRSPSEQRAEDNKNHGVNLPLLLAAHLGRNENSQPLQSTLTSAYGGHQPSNSLGGNLPPNDSTGCVTLFVRWIEDYPLPDGLNMLSHVGSYYGKGDPDNYLYLFEGAIHMQKYEMLKTRSLVEFLSTDLPTTYKGLMEKTYTWIEAKEVATNGATNDHWEGFDNFSKGSSWDNNKGRKKSGGRFSPYRGSNYGLLSNLSKSQREIQATKKVEKTFEQPPHMELKHQIKEAIKLGQLTYLMKGINKGKEKASDTQLEDMLIDIQETLDKLRAINMKLNPKKYSFGTEKGPFLGHLITKQGIKADPSKVKEISDLKMPKTLKEI
uniref:Reverse transcriptase domain-containing protein n=1 Tax=Tanacetum cinerariifolium TaxID=118510 RepID=A0A6L2NHE5_TANCI|nr:reverse transcriptase domain-containing protein [Tanacetum cinerariifolium]